MQGRVLVFFVCQPTPYHPCEKSRWRQLFIKTYTLLTNLFSVIYYKGNNNNNYMIQDYKELKRHLGHNIVCVSYGKNKDNIAVECEDCNEVLMDEDKLNELLEDEEEETFICKGCGCDEYNDIDNCCVKCGKAI